MLETLLTKVHRMEANCGAIALERSGLTPRRTAEHTHHDTSMDSNSSDLERFKGRMIARHTRRTLDGSNGSNKWFDAREHCSMLDSLSGAVIVR